MTTLTGLDGLREAEGRELGVTEWREITQAEVDAFADATGDHQWIHVDPERAAASPLGGTIAHGLLTLSLAPAMTASLLSFEGFAFALNYGYDRVRFPAPLPGRRAPADARDARLRDGHPRRRADHDRADLRGRGRRRSRCAWRSRWRGCTSGSDLRPRSRGHFTAYIGAR